MKTTLCLCLLLCLAFTFVSASHDEIRGKAASRRPLLIFGDDDDGFGDDGQDDDGFGDDGQDDDDGYGSYTGSYTGSYGNDDDDGLDDDAFGSDDGRDDDGGVFFVGRKLKENHDLERAAARRPLLIFGDDDDGFGDDGQDDDGFGDDGQDDDDGYGSYTGSYTGSYGNDDDDGLDDDDFGSDDGRDDDDGVFFVGRKLKGTMDVGKVAGRRSL